MGALITLTTDFDLKDGYVAAVKGVIASINPKAAIVDICHTIEPQNTREATEFLKAKVRGEVLVKAQKSRKVG